MEQVRNEPCFTSSTPVIVSHPSKGLGPKRFGDNTCNFCSGKGRTASPLDSLRVRTGPGILIHPRKRTRPLSGMVNAGLCPAPRLFRRVLSARKIVVSRGGGALAVGSSRIGEGLRCRLGSRRLTGLVTRGFGPSNGGDSGRSGIMAVSRHLSVVGRIVRNSFGSRVAQRVLGSGSCIDVYLGPRIRGRLFVDRTRTARRRGRLSIVTLRRSHTDCRANCVSG